MAMRNEKSEDATADVSQLLTDGTAQLLEIVKEATGRVLKKVKVQPHASGLGYQIDAEELGRLTGFARVISVLSEARANEKKSDDELNQRVAKELKRLLAEAGAP